MSDPGDINRVTTLQRALFDFRQERRRIQHRIDELEQEIDQTFRQRDQYDLLIEKNEEALQDALSLPGSPLPRKSDHAQPTSRPYQHQSAQQASSSYSTTPRRESYDRRLRPSDIDQAIEEAERSDRGSNVRFADFRIPQAATIVLREARSSLHVSEIFRRMEAGGFEFRGQHQLITLAVSLSRSKRFRKVAPGTFELDPEFLAGQVA
jgi:hypothetical protein